jgi:type II secretory pathway predicted ATPase ExeA
MYHNHWGLNEPPFRNSLETRDFYGNGTHEEALARLHFLVDCRRRLGLLLSAPGCGKSFVLEVLAGELRRAGSQVAKVSLLGFEPAEFLWGLARGWGLNPEVSTSSAELWRQIIDRLAEHRFEQLASVALIDDADEASPQVLAQVVRLAQSQTSSDARLTIVVSSRTANLAQLSGRLLELADLRIDVEPWQQPETEGFVRHMLAQAGRSAATFTPDALARLHELTGGVPRNINQMAELALLAAAGQGLDLVDVHTIETVFDELSVTSNA